VHHIPSHLEHLARRDEIVGQRDIRMIRCSSPSYANVIELAPCVIVFGRSKGVYVSVAPPGRVVWLPTAL
jgi:hypothetical protein